MSKMKLPKNSPQALYLQIKAAIQARIDSGDWVPGFKVPSEHTLVDELGVSRMTVNRALRELTQEHVLERVAGVGTFVSEPPRHISLIELRDIAEEIRAQGHTHRADVLLLARESATRTVADRLHLELGSLVYHGMFIHYQNDTPVQLEDRYVNPIVAADFIHTDFSAVTPTQYLMSTVRLDELEHVVKAIRPDPVTCERLNINPDEACLKLERRTWNAGRVVTLCSFTYPGSRYEFGAHYGSTEFRRRQA